MPRYECVNAECENFGRKIQENSVIKFVKGELVDTAILCPKCGEERVPLIEEGMTTYMTGSANICKK